MYMIERLVLVQHHDVWPGIVILKVWTLSTRCSLFNSKMELDSIQVGPVLSTRHGVYRQHMKWNSLLQLDSIHNLASS